MQNNEELFEYLVQIGGNLEKHQLYELAEIVTQARRFASGSASEFLHETQLALELVREKQPKELSDSEIQDLDEVLTQIKEAFRQIGGA